MGVQEESFRPEVEEIAGAAFFLNEAKESRISLFI
jgi:peroxiredoxin family protein